MGDAVEEAAGPLLADAQHHGAATAAAALIASAYVAVGPKHQTVRGHGAGQAGRMHPGPLLLEQERHPRGRALVAQGAGPFAMMREALTALFGDARATTLLAPSQA